MTAKRNVFISTHCHLVSTVFVIWKLNANSSFNTNCSFDRNMFKKAAPVSAD